jgi:hypothetical protein
MTKRWSAVVCCVLACGLVALVALLPLTRVYSSKSFTLNGSRMRIEVVVPGGWVAGDLRFENEDGAQIVELTLMPKQGSRWLPRWLAFWRDPSSSNENAYMDIAVGPDVARTIPSFNTIVSWIYSPDGKTAERKLTGAFGDACIHYTRTNQSEFEQTCRQVCESFKVIVEKE